MKNQRGKRVIKKIVGILVLIGIWLPVTSVLANEKGEAGNDGEIEFYLDQDSSKPIVKPTPTPKPNPKPIIKLPQTSNRTNLPAAFIGTILLLIGGVTVRERMRKDV